MPKIRTKLYNNFMTSYINMYANIVEHSLAVAFVHYVQRIPAAVVAVFVADEEALVPVGTAVTATHRLVVLWTVPAVAAASAAVRKVNQR